MRSSTKVTTILTQRMKTSQRESTKNETIVEPFKVKVEAILISNNYASICLLRVKFNPCLYLKHTAGAYIVRKYNFLLPKFKSLVGVFYGNGYAGVVGLQAM